LAKALEKTAWLDLVANQEKMGEKIGNYMDKLITEVNKCWKICDKSNGANLYKIVWEIIKESTKVKLIYSFTEITVRGNKECLLFLTLSMNINLF
jgi:hypothetical protein